MASPIGDNIDLLSTTTPLTAGGTWTSPAVVLGVYNSLVVMVKTDVESELYIEWSGDQGVNWDASEANTIIDTVTKRVVITTQQKTIRLRLVNGPTNQTYLRLFTYGVVTNNSSLVSLVNSIDVSNLISGLSGSQTHTVELTPLVEYNFQQVRTSLEACNNRTFSAGYNDLWSYSPSLNPLCGSGSTANQYRYVLLRNSAVGEAVITGRAFTPQGGTTYVARFVGSYAIYDSPSSRLVMGVSKNVATATPLDIGNVQWWGGFGWVQDGAVKTNDNFSIVYGQSFYVERTSWSLDKADGNSTLPEIDFTDPLKFNMFQVEFTMGGNIRFSIMNPATDKFVPVHEIRNLNSTSFQPGTRTMQFLMFNKIVTTGGVGNDQVNCNNFSLCMDLPKPKGLAMCQNVSFDVSVGGATINPIAIRPWLLGPNDISFTAVCLNNISISSSGLAPVVVKLLQDGTVTGGSWTQDGTLPIEYNTTATITPTARVIYEFSLSDNDSLHREFNPNNSFLFDLRTVTIQVISKSTSDVRICLGMSQP
jgi:hypothetical protein